MREHGLKTCLYSGCDSIQPFEQFLSLLDYLKIGHYDEKLGGLDKQTTNQRFYRIEQGKLIDETEQFQRRKEEHDA